MSEFAASLSRPPGRASFYSDLDVVDSRRGSAVSLFERMNEGLVVAELTTDVKLEDRHLVDLSGALSKLYKTRVMTIAACPARVLFKNSFERVYKLTIFSLSAQLQPTLNKRSACVIQRFLETLINVPMDRGVICFIPVPEEAFATNGNTTFGQNAALAMRHEPPVYHHCERFQDVRDFSSTREATRAAPTAISRLFAQCTLPRTIRKFVNRASRH